MNFRALPMLVLGASVVIVSTSAIMIRGALGEGVASLSIATWRLGLAAFILTFIVIAKPATRAEIAALSLKSGLLAVASGVFLAAHFASWIASLSYTSVASSTALVTTNPIWIALVSWLIFRERLQRSLVIGIASAMLGSVLIFLSDARAAAANVGSNPMLGNALAVVGSLTVCGYLLIGRRLRQTFSLLTYIWLVYLSAAITLFVCAVLAHAPLAGFTMLAWACLAGLAIGPQLLGHTGINWSLKHAPATVVAVAILGEPIASALLAWWIFDERFQPLQLAGFSLLLVGIFLSTRNVVPSGASTKLPNADEISAN
jgi:drug/metabolite transporter (DMT)-like permease